MTFVTHAFAVKLIHSIFPNVCSYRLRKACELINSQDFRSDENKQKIHTCVLSSIEVHLKSIEFSEF